MVWLAPDFFLYKQDSGYRSSYKATFGTPIRPWTRDEIAQLKALKTVYLNLWPKYLNPEAYDFNSRNLLDAGFSLAHTDITYVVDLRDNRNWLQKLPPPQRWKIKKAEKLGVEFHSRANLSPQEILTFLTKNRNHKGYPVSLDFPTLCAAFEQGNTPDFWVSSVVYPDFSLAALAIVRKLTTNTLYTFLLADDPDKRQISGTAFLIYKLSDLASRMGFAYLDLGIATEKGIANEGLTAFKKSITDFSSEKALFRLDA